MTTVATSSSKRVAVVGSGLAGLTTAHLLQKNGCEVELFEKASAVGMDAGSLDVDGVRVDVPFRVITPDYYPYLHSLYNYLDIKFAVADYSMGFTDEHGKSIWSYTNMALGNFQMSIPDSIRRGARLAVTRDWVRLVFACLRIMRTPALLRPGGRLASLTIGQYLEKEHYGREFTTRVFIPFIASMLTCSLSAAELYPATVILHLISKAVCGTRLRKAKNGVQEVCKLLTRNIFKIHLDSSVERVVLHDKDYADKRRVLLVTADGKEHWFDEVVLATPADRAARILCSVETEEKQNEFPSRELLQALESVNYEDTHVFTHRDESVMPAQRAEWRGVNIRTAAKKDRVMASHWINYVERTSSGSVLNTEVFQTIDPLVQLDNAKVISTTAFHRSLVTIESQAQINTIHKHQGQCGIWLVGTYTSPGVPLLEGCVRTAVDVVRAISGSVPFAAPRMMRTSHSGKTYEVGLAPGMARGEIVEAYFECDAAGTFAFPCPLLASQAIKSGAAMHKSGLAVRLRAWMAWLGFAVVLPLLTVFLSVAGTATRSLLGTDLGSRVQLAALDILVYLACMSQLTYKWATTSIL
ncbi:FAD/NAD(P)-binding domain-containing protein [Coemansia reversa NRRL 1564]|uniref:FAD/NAD(P)-binding domain-containing protein n=1 Tax=Coemansia reversa (strain ATCC 12441 / NRRL 1564) TaxID=763665 RepID=A0A2G5BK63_COERN|nr:FAD/NAD(P)-binding domain-containing protein [Coemansia reversa NRRL 1564]|eukprot:PIA19389.1 FAD/NAD(P)-binding domain-containing protein [Coemansia reversa NRRL 1564]